MGFGGSCPGAGTVESLAYLLAAWSHYPQRRPPRGARALDGRQRQHRMGPQRAWPGLRAAAGFVCLGFRVSARARGSGVWQAWCRRLSGFGSAGSRRRSRASFWGSGRWRPRRTSRQQRASKARTVGVVDQVRGQEVCSGLGDRPIRTVAAPLTGMATVASSPTASTRPGGGSPAGSGKARSAGSARGCLRQRDGQDALQGTRGSYETHRAGSRLLAASRDTAICGSKPNRLLASPVEGSGCRRGDFGPSGCDGLWRLLLPGEGDPGAAGGCLFPGRCPYGQEAGREQPPPRPSLCSGGGAGQCPGRQPPVLGLPAGRPTPDRLPSLRATPAVPGCSRRQGTDSGEAGTDARYLDPFPSCWLLSCLLLRWLWREQLDHLGHSSVGELPEGRVGLTPVLVAGLAAE